MTTFWLSTHLAYACRHSGACCTAGWPIPIERDRADEVAAAIATGRIDAPAVWYRSEPDAPAEVAGILARRASGACVFHRHSPPPADRGASPSGCCAIHASRPVSCRHFPYVCAIDPRGVHVTLSHYCPSAADLLFDADGDVAIVEGPPVPVDGPLEGLDARESLPPLAHGGQSPDTTRIRGLSPESPRSRSLSPESGRRRGLSPLGGEVAGAGRPQLLSWDDVTGWEGTLVERLARESCVPAPPEMTAFDRARAAVASGWSWPEAPAGVRAAWETLVAPEWARWRRAIGRYLAARAHGSWALYLGAGCSDVEEMVGRARTVLQVEAVRACLVRHTRLDRQTLTEAVRRSDLLLVHYTDPFRSETGEWRNASTTMGEP